MAGAGSRWNCHLSRGGPGQVQGETQALGFGEAEHSLEGELHGP